MFFHLYFPPAIRRGSHRLDGPETPDTTPCIEKRQGNLTIACRPGVSLPNTTNPNL